MVNYLQTPSAVLRVTGPDANTFLQGQFSQNLRLFLGEIAYGLWLNQKGRPVADSFVARVSDDEHWLFSFHAVGEVIRQRLEAYLIADEVEVSDVSDEWTAFAVWGTAAEATLKGLGWEVPGAGKHAIAEGAFLFRARFAAGINFAVICRREFASTVSAKLRAAGGAEAGVGELTRARIEAGVADVPDDIGLNELPNEGGLDESAVSFTKGCFLGQEVMARLKNLGTVRRRLHRIRGAGAPPSRLAEIFQGDKKVGETRTAAAAGDAFVGMAIISLMNFDRGSPARLADGRAVKVEELGHG